ncbi:hypothetical protein [Lutibacter flavus]|uniref:Lipoprotein n=1 Tax=Lutibacter flavus TaxID=691689 RepID=A0A238VUG3_9FLAO|nr:hypothetical protein [Lutibacter flavus]SNR37821.1 hypothetical protein SAMN04488111_1042 [Lutibacter flavus]
MKKLLIINILILSLISCSEKQKKEPESYIENRTSFFDLRNSDWTKNDWIRKPENLKIIHETFKKFGYENLEKLINKYDNEFLIENIYIKRNFDNLIDSLELSYKNLKTENKYYVEFWERRKKEKNDSIVYEIIREIKSQKENNEKLICDNRFVNDTLFDLLKIEFYDKDLNNEKAEKDFEKLKNYGFHQSAYNLLYERHEYSELKLDRDKMKTDLTKSSEFINPWFQDNTK